MTVLSSISNLFSLKYIALATLVLQNTFLIIFMSMSRTKVQDGPLYASSTAVVTMELLKMVSCLLVVFYESVVAALQEKEHNSSIIPIVRAIRIYFNTLKNEVTNKPMELLKLSVPSFLYTIQVLTQLIV